MKGPLCCLGFLTGALTARTVACRCDVVGECEPADADSENGLGEEGVEENRSVGRRRRAGRLEVGHHGLQKWVGLSSLALDEEEEV